MGGHGEDWQARTMGTAPLGKPSSGTVFYLCFHEDNGFFQARLAGICRFARLQGWRVVALPPERSTGADVRALAAQSRPLGFLVDESFCDVRLSSRDFCGLPVVRIDPSDQPCTGVATTVLCDNTAVAQTAFDELSAGLPPCYAVVTYRSQRIWARERVAAFRSICRSAGAKCLVFPERYGEAPDSRAARLASWAVALPPHCAIFAVNDYTAWETWVALRSKARHVPKTATLIGVDGFDRVPDGDLSCISSVRLDFERMGYLAARTLAEIVDGTHPARRIVTLGPLLVIRRESTRGRGRRDARILEAAEMIRREASEGLTVATLAKRFSCSRRLFEIRFREAMGHSVLDEILHVRLEHAQTLLARGDIPISAVADFCGFGSERQMRRIFIASTGMPPREWRRTNFL